MNTIKLESTYEKQAREFMEKTGTTMTVKLLGPMPYFEDDKENRDVYQVTLTRNGKEYSFRFGQSLAHSKEFVNAEIEKKWRNDFRTFPQEIRKARAQIQAPRTYDVLASVTKSDPGIFEDFCSECGYSTDSRKAEKTYFAVQKEWTGVSRLFSDVMDELQEIQ